MVKKFTVNCDFGEQKSSVDLYIGDPAVGSHPLAFQSKWLSVERHGSIPEGITNSFTKLVGISEKNRVPFEDLCEYVIAELRSASTIVEDAKKAISLSKKTDKKDG